MFEYLKLLVPRISRCFFLMLRVAFLEILWSLGSLVRFMFGCIFEKFAFFLENVEPSILNDPTTILLYFGALRPPGTLQKEEKINAQISCF